MRKEKEEVVIKADNVNVRILELSEGEEAPWHYHTEIIDNMFCLEGRIRISLKEPEETVILLPGQRCKVVSPRVHRVTNPTRKRAKYLLVQGVGRYDFNVVEL